MDRTNNHLQLLHDERRDGEFRSSALPSISVAHLSTSSTLRRAVEQSLRPDRIRLTPVRSVALVEAMIKKRLCEIAIVDVEGHDQWPNLVFSLFDEIAANFPIIILCGSRHEALQYIWKAQHTFDIFPYDAVSKSCFQSVVEAAKLRSEVIEDAKPDSKLKDPPAA